MRQPVRSAVTRSVWTKSLFECVVSRIYAASAVSALSLEQARACKTGCPLLARSLWAGLRQPRRQGFLGQAIEIPHSNRLLDGSQLARVIVRIAGVGQGANAMVLLLARVVGVGLETADMLVHETPPAACATAGRWRATPASPGHRTRALI